MAINPNGKLPSDADGALKLFKALAIDPYLAAKARQSTLQPGALPKVRHWPSNGRSEPVPECKPRCCSPCCMPLV